MQSKVRSSSRGRAVVICALGVVVALTTIASGSAGARLRATSHADRINGSRGPDLLRGLGGNDLMRGGGGNDRLYGGPGNDRLYGGAGNDSLTGGPGRDRLFGERGNDRIYASSDGADIVDCGAGKDTVVLDRSDHARGCERVRRVAPGATGDASGDTSPTVGGPFVPFDGPATSSDSRPNIVLILTDDQRCDTIVAADPNDPEFCDTIDTRQVHPLPYMPNVSDKLASQGISFSRAYITRSQCCPSRASFLTGQYAHNHGVHTNTWSDVEPNPHGGFRAFNDSSTIATWLYNAGYRTGLVGKYLNQYRGCAPDVSCDHTPTKLYKPPGWDTFNAFVGDTAYYNYTLDVNDAAKPYGSSGADYSTNVLADGAVNFIGDAASDPSPFFLEFTPFAPHSPSIPANADKSLYPNLDLGEATAFNESEDTLQYKPEWVSGLPLITNDDPDKEIERLKKLHLDELRSLNAVDVAVGRIVDKLQSLGKLDNTWIVFMSDNGYLLGEHRVEGKRAAFQESIRVPMIVRGPGVPATQYGSRDDHIVANIDLAPTFAALAGAKPDLKDAKGASVNPDGRSLLPLLQGLQPTDWRQDLLIENWIDRICDTGDKCGKGIPNQNPEIPNFKALHTPNFDFVKYYNGDIGEWGDATGEYELYNIATDPWELNNLASTTDKETMGKFSARVKDLWTCSGDGCNTLPPN